MGLISTLLSEREESVHLWSERRERPDNSPPVSPVAHAQRKQAGENSRAPHRIRLNIIKGIKRWS